MTPDGATPEEFRSALGAFATGVTVVTAVGPQGRSGATANAVASLSLEPPMMLACLDRGSRTLTSVRAQGRFGVNVLAAGQAELARRFSAKDPEPDKWDGVEWSERQGLPRLEGSLVWVACELRDLIDGGDHLILTGNVIEAESGEGQPLLFHRGDYRDLLAES
ncbi:MAG TPA: flavin reductase family protein [Solirubrobacterales bacterium]|jgi:3-hydroxy-9,10-secoandrosta-1,3,5(10)-triene-9,17-dione monooxygenase reductase component